MVSVSQSDDRVKREASVTDILNIVRFFYLHLFNFISSRVHYDKQIIKGVTSFSNPGKLEYSSLEFASVPTNNNLKSLASTSGYCSWELKRNSKLEYCMVTVPKFYSTFFLHQSCHWSWYLLFCIAIVTL